MSIQFYGSALCEVDADGSVALPAFLSEALESAEAPELLVASHEADPCLIGYDHQHLHTLAERNERRRLAGEAIGADAGSHYRRMRRTFGLVDRMERGPATLRIPPAMRHIGRIHGLALFVGTGDSFEIWNPDLAAESDDAPLRALASFRIAAHGTKGVH